MNNKPFVTQEFLKRLPPMDDAVKDQILEILHDAYLEAKERVEQLLDSKK